MFASGFQDPVICFIQTYLYMYYGWCDVLAIFTDQTYVDVDVDVTYQTQGRVFDM